MHNLTNLPCVIMQTNRIGDAGKDFAIAAFQHPGDAVRYLRWDVEEMGGSTYMIYEGERASFGDEGICYDGFRRWREMRRACAA